MRFLCYANDLYHFGTALCPKKIAPTFVCGETAEKRQYSKQVDGQSNFRAELRYWVIRNSKFWSILFFAFRFNFNMSQDPDSMQSPKQVSDFDADAWFWRSRRLKFVSVYSILY